ncbi:TRAM domain protein [Natronomonas moolapensis 8.8.11]|uniref:TRAM domain protein n=1 Tax=Natronomonas moolapensis (strain DSM 18674 / CECT 7526 / JCM 14361 / 8.8.11) TaxID=268739 RepID=M1XQU5_NATM8|nr:TRAM domain-containing protein [Natronomonas moolapensis]CCQ36489.1 TRAM domain protein [Natronomonas moolapensis 8.8.11]
MEISDRLECLFAADIEETNGSYVIDVPERELELGGLATERTYRVAILPAAVTDAASPEDTPNADEEPASPPESEPTPAEHGTQSPPVEEGDRRRVEIEDIGEQGDGITRVERGFVVIVPDTDRGERVVVEITDVAETVAFAEVVERISYYE